MAGSRSKGARDLFTIRPHAEVGEVLRELHNHSEYKYMSEFLSALLAEKVGRPDLAPPLTATNRRVHEQAEKLPVEHEGLRMTG